MKFNFDSILDFFYFLIYSLKKKLLGFDYKEKKSWLRLFFTMKINGFGLNSFFL